VMDNATKSNKLDQTLNKQRSTSAKGPKPLTQVNYLEHLRELQDNEYQHQ